MGVMLLGPRQPTQPGTSSGGTAGVSQPVCLHRQASPWGLGSLSWGELLVLGASGASLLPTTSGPRDSPRWT